jgi:mono/diheme cytochrome c family protein
MWVQLPPGACQDDGMTTTFRLLLTLTVALWTVGTVAQTQQKEPTKTPTKESPAREKALETYKTICMPCHGPDGNAPIKEMSLVDDEWKHGSSQAAIVKTITDGVPGTAMLPNKDKLSRAEIAELAKLVKSFAPTTKKPVKER